MIKFNALEVSHRCLYCINIGKKKIGAYHKTKLAQINKVLKARSKKCKYVTKIFLQIQD